LKLDKEKKMKKLLLFFTICIIFVSGVYGKELKNEEEIAALCESIMQEVGKGNIEEGFKLMKPYTLLPTTEFDSAVLQSKSARDQFGKRYGETIGYEYIETKKVGTSLILIHYIEKTKNHALLWSFYFYKARDSWLLNTFNWSDVYQTLFQ